MSNKPEYMLLRKVLHMALCALTFLFPAVIWFALRLLCTNVPENTASIIALASGYIVLAVFMFHQHFKTSAIHLGSRQMRGEIKDLRTEFGKLYRVVTSLRKEEAVASTRNEAATAPVRTILPETKTNLRDVAYITHLNQNPPNPIQKPEQPHSPPDSYVSELPENEILDRLNAKFIELIKMLEITPDRLASQLKQYSDELSSNGFQVAVIYRNAAFAEAMDYRIDPRDMSSASPSIKGTLQNGKTLLYPAPMAGQDNFHDVNAFESNTPKPSQMRSCLTHCIHAELEATSNDSYKPIRKGRLTFR